MIPLRNGHWTNDYRLDRMRAVDLRSLDFLARDALTLEQLREPRSYTWACDKFLDQGVDGACVGFAFAHELAARPGLVTGVDARYARERIYWEAQRLDPWAGGSYPDASPLYEGTSTLAGAQVVHRAGLIAEYRWALDVLEFAAAISYSGPGVMGVDWYEHMLDADRDGFIHPTGRWAGGHCVMVHGVTVRRDGFGAIDWLRSNFLIRNSWGRYWGTDGGARITFLEMAALVPGGEFCIPIGRRAAAL